MCYSFSSYDYLNHFIGFKSKFHDKQCKDILSSTKISKGVVKADNSYSCLDKIEILYVFKMYIF